MHKKIKNTNLNDYRDSLIEENLPLVRKLASSVFAPGIELDDLIGHGVLGLIRAAQKYDQSKGINFSAFARSHIKGAMLDQLRANDTLSRWTRKKLKTNNPEEINNKYQHLADFHLLSLDELQGEDYSLLETIPDESDGPAEIYELKARRKLLKLALHKLPEREKRILIMHNYSQFTFKKIAETLGITESRSHQLHKRGLELMRVGLLQSSI